MNTTGRYTVKARWYVPALDSYESATVHANSYAEAVDKINAQYDAGIELHSHHSKREGWAHGRRVALSISR